MYTLNKEIIPLDSNEYSEFGLPYKTYPYKTDPTDCCLSDTPWHCYETANIGMCPKFMSGRCADSWDEKCDLYINKLNDVVSIQKFLKGVASKKYCRLSDNSNCSLKCEPYDPMNQTSAMVCEYYGNETLVDKAADLDIGYYNKVNISPDYMGKCSLTCDKIAGITPDDKVINTCLSSGLCDEELNNICKVAQATNTTINNTALQTYCNITLGKKEGFNSHTSLPKQMKMVGKSDTTDNYIIGGVALAIIAIVIFMYWKNNKKRR